jgi:hypothetical protein
MTRIAWLALVVCAACAGDPPCSAPDSLFHAWTSSTSTLRGDGQEILATIDLSKAAYGVSQPATGVGAFGLLCPYRADIQRSMLSDGDERGSLLLTLDSKTPTLFCLPDGSASTMELAYEVNCSTLSLVNGSGSATYRR